MTVILINVANYHADKACAAYLSGDMDGWCRHIAIADRIRFDLRGIA